MSNKVVVNATINGDPVEFLCEPRQSLLEVLRETIQLTGTKEGCGSGDCGACSVMVDGRLVCSCLVLGPEVEGRSIETIEGIGPANAAKLSGAGISTVEDIESTGIEPDWTIETLDILISALERRGG